MAVTPFLVEVHNGTHPPLPFPSNKFVELMAFENNTYIASAHYTANSLYALIQQINHSVGPFNITKFIRSQCQAGVINPNQTFSDWNGTMDSFFVACMSACQGVLIPDCDLDIYDCANDCGTPCGPSYFFANAQSLLGLTAIQWQVAQGYGYVHLEAWDAFWSDNNPTQASVNAFFTSMRAMGWTAFMPQVNNPANYGSSCNVNITHVDFGNAGYIRNGLFDIDNTTSPYIFPEVGTICSIWNTEPALNGILVAIESQQQQNGQYYCNGKYNSAIAAFTNCLNSSQQVTALISMAQNQGSGANGFPYTFVYPVLVIQGMGVNGITWDASAQSQLPLILQLMNEYNSTPPRQWPTGNRSAIFIRFVDFSNAAYNGSATSHGDWGPNGYNGGDVLNWINTLQLNTLYRFTGVVRIQDSNVKLKNLNNYPDNDPSGWGDKTVLQFIQACVAELQPPIAEYPRHSWTEVPGGHGSGSQFLLIAQQMLQFQQQLNLPKLLLSIDNFNNADPDEETNIQLLYNMGWQGIALGACGLSNQQVNLPQATYGFICLGSSGIVQIPNSNYDPAMGQTSTKWDDPLGTDDLMSNMTNYPNGDASPVAEVILSAAQQQASIGSGCILAYPVWQTGNLYNCESVNLTCQTSGPFWNNGDTLFTAIKNIMNAYNP